MVTKGHKLTRVTPVAKTKPQVSNPKEPTQLIV
jgi:hypothetical protein